jgi:3-mercaptopyruvate sulfurtransferase SseA
MGGGGTSGGGATGGSGTTGGANTSVPAANPTSPASQQTPGDEPPRIELKEFKALYDDPAKRPLIIDVRTKEIYDQGHIKGAISFPEAEVDARVSELPKDKLIVAYCQ